MLSLSRLLSRWPALVGAGVAFATATTLWSRVGDGLGALASLVCATWCGWITLAACTAVAEALRPSLLDPRALRTSLSAANDDVEHAVVIRLRR